MHDPVLAIHIAAGAVGLALGPIALPPLVRRDAESSYYLAYQTAVAVTVATAIILVGLSWSRLWWLAIIAIAVEGAALGGLWAPRAAFPGWRAWRIRFTWGTYVGLVTALLVVSWDTPLAWIIPTLVAIPVIGRAASLASST